MKWITDIDLRDKRVLVRVDFNVPLNDDGQITDDARIQAALPTLSYVLDHGGQLIVASHLGRPNDQFVAKMSLRPAAERLGQLLGREVLMAPDCVGAAVADLVAHTPKDKVVMLENLRFHAQEQANDDDFGKQLAALCDVYINDAFAVSHRAHASVAAIVNHVDSAAGGFLLKREMDYFHQALTDPQRPLAAIIGGAKVSSKIDVLTHLLKRVDMLLIGGAMANTFLKAGGLNVGISKVEDDFLETARQVLSQAAAHGVKLLLPTDVVVSAEFSANAATAVVRADQMPPDQMALDIGPETISAYNQALATARTIIWNGPMGVFEMAAFAQGTNGVAHCVANSDALTIIGGGDTGAAVHQAGVADQMSYISTGGGAFLELMEGKTLPALAALEGCCPA